MTQRIYTDRSRVISWQRCNRARYLNYHQDGVGIQPSKTPLPLAVGGAVHAGLEVLLRDGQAFLNAHPSAAQPVEFGTGGWSTIEEKAVAAAVADLAEHRGALELDLAESTAQSDAAATQDANAQFAQQLAGSIGMTVEEAGLALQPADPSARAREWDEWLWSEQSALVEGMVRAYARRRLRPLLEEFEVLEVEREGEWLLSVQPHCIHTDENDHQACGRCGFGPQVNADFDAPCYELWFMSRPDALLRSRSDNSLYLLSYKTAATWDVRKARDAERDMQGLSEGIEVERRLAEWWEQIHVTEASTIRIDDASPTMIAYLRSLSAPPRILGIR